MWQQILLEPLRVQTFSLLGPQTSADGSPAPYFEAVLLALMVPAVGDDSDARFFEGLLDGSLPQAIPFLPVPSRQTPLALLIAIASLDQEYSFRSLTTRPNPGMAHLQHVCVGPEARQVTLPDQDPRGVGDARSYPVGQGWVLFRVGTTMAFRATQVDKMASTRGTDLGRLRPRSLSLLLPVTSLRHRRPELHGCSGQSTQTSWHWFVLTNPGVPSLWLVPLLPPESPHQDQTRGSADVLPDPPPAHFLQRSPTPMNLIGP